MGVLLLVAVVAGAPPVEAATDLLAFTRTEALRQGAFEAAGIAWSCGGELCSAKGPDDTALWPGLCAAFVREAGAVAAFGSVRSRFDAAALVRCNESGAIRPELAPRSAPRPETPAAASPRAAEPPAEIAPPPEIGAGEICNGRDDDGDGRIDEGVRLRVWEDRDHDLHGDPLRSREICAHEQSPGLVLNDYDCDDADPKRNPARDNCG